MYVCTLVGIYVLCLCIPHRHTRANILNAYIEMYYVNYTYGFFKAYGHSACITFFLSLACPFSQLEVRPLLHTNKSKIAFKTKFVPLILI